MKNKTNFLLLTLIGVLFSVSVPKISGQTIKKAKNEVILLGMIHSGHKTDPVYNIDYLKKLIREIDPDYILTEIPPDRFDEAVRQFKATGKITESRVKVFPEYVDVVFPLTRELKFEIIPTAGWTKFMNDDRRQKLRKIRENPARKEGVKDHGKTVVFCVRPVELRKEDR